MITYTAVSFLGNRSAEIAQLVEHFTRNEGVVSSSLIFSLNDRASHSRYFSDELDAQFFCLKKNVCLQNKISMVQFVHNTK